MVVFRLWMDVVDIIEGFSMKNNGIKPETWKEFLRFKKDIETMLDKKVDNDYLMNLLIIEGKLITYGKTIECKTEKIDMPSDDIKNDEKNIGSAKSQPPEEK